MNVPFREVSGHNLESSQTCGFCMDFLNHREGGMVFYQVFLLSPSRDPFRQFFLLTATTSNKNLKIKVIEELEIQML
jgi:hypothetical protein